MTEESPGGGVLYAVSDQVATITMNRPERLNAFTRETLKEIAARVDEAATDVDVGVIVLRGAGGRAFSAGGDVNIENAETMDGPGSFDDLSMTLYERFRACPKPIIAQVDGYAIGGGNHLAYMCDFTVASTRSIFGQNGARVASPAEGWLVSYLWSVVGMKRAKEIWMLCRRYSAEQALEWGLVNSVVAPEELDEEVARWCREVLSLSPTVVALLKRSFDESHDEMRERLGKDRVLNRVNPGFWTSGEQEEGAAAFLEKRAPDFSRWRL